MKRILLILGHPDTGSLCGALADAYHRGAESSGAEVRRIDLGSLAFDPVLHRGYAEIQPLEPDLVAAQEAIQWAEHLVFVHPVWWSGLPALLKGFVDRVFLPGFAFKYAEKNDTFWTRMLKGRTARILATMDAPGWYYRWFNGAPGLKELKTGILAFCGVKTLGASHFGPVKTSDSVRREAWIAAAESLGRRFA